MTKLYVIFTGLLMIWNKNDPTQNQGFALLRSEAGETINAIPQPITIPMHNATIEYRSSDGRVMGPLKGDVTFSLASSQPFSVQSLGALDFKALMRADLDSSEVLSDCVSDQAPGPDCQDILSGRVKLSNGKLVRRPKCQLSYM